MPVLPVPTQNSSARLRTGNHDPRANIPTAAPKHAVRPKPNDRPALPHDPGPAASIDRLSDPARPTLPAMPAQYRKL